MHTAYTLTLEVGTPGAGVCGLLEGAFHGLGVVHTCADGEVEDKLTLAWVNRSMVGVHEVDMIL